MKISPEIYMIPLCLGRDIKDILLENGINERISPFEVMDVNSRYLVDRFETDFVGMLDGLLYNDPHLEDKRYPELPYLLSKEYLLEEKREEMIKTINTFKNVLNTDLKKIFMYSTELKNETEEEFKSNIIELNRIIDMKYKNYELIVVVKGRSMDRILMDNLIHYTVDTNEEEVWKRIIQDHIPRFITSNEIDDLIHPKRRRGAVLCIGDFDYSNKKYLTCLFSLRKLLDRMRDEECVGGVDIYVITDSADSFDIYNKFFEGERNITIYSKLSEEIKTDRECLEGYKYTSIYRDELDHRIETMSQEYEMNFVGFINKYWEKLFIGSEIVKIYETHEGFEYDFILKLTTDTKIRSEEFNYRYVVDVLSNKNRFFMDNIWIALGSSEMMHFYADLIKYYGSYELGMFSDDVYFNGVWYSKDYNEIDRVKWNYSQECQLGEHIAKKKKENKLLEIYGIKMGEYCSP